MTVPTGTVRPPRFSATGAATPPYRFAKSSLTRLDLPNPARAKTKERRLTICRTMSNRGMTAGSRICNRSSPPTRGSWPPYTNSPKARKPSSTALELSALAPGHMTQQLVGQERHLGSYMRQATVRGHENRLLVASIAEHTEDSDVDAILQELFSQILRNGPVFALLAQRIVLTSRRHQPALRRDRCDTSQDGLVVVL